MRAAYVVACDGGTGGVREGLGVKLVGSTYTERWLVVDAIVPNHSVKGIAFRCDPRRPTVELPAVGDRVRWEFMQLPGESEEKLSRDETVRALVKEKPASTPSKSSARLSTPSMPASPTVGALGAFSSPATPPTSCRLSRGRGMNGGMKDAADLSWKLAAVLNGQASDEILDTYEAERAPVVRRMVEVSRRLGSIVVPTNQAIAAARELGFRLPQSIAPLCAFVGRGGVVPPPAIHCSALTASGKDALIGQMAAQPTAKSSLGETPLDRFPGSVDGSRLDSGWTRRDAVGQNFAILEALGAQFVALNPLGPIKSGRTSVLECSDPKFIAWAGKHGVRGIFVRPDRFIAAELDASGDLAVLNPVRQGDRRGSAKGGLTTAS